MKKNKLGLIIFILGALLVMFTTTIHVFIQGGPVDGLITLGLQLMLIGLVVLLFQ